MRTCMQWSSICRCAHGWAVCFRSKHCSTQPCCLSQAQQFGHLRAVYRYIKSYELFARFQRYRPATKTPHDRWKYAIDCVLHDLRSKRASRCGNATMHGATRATARFHRVLRGDRPTSAAMRARREFRDLYVHMHKLHLAAKSHNEKGRLLLPPLALPAMPVEMTKAAKRNRETVLLRATKTLDRTRTWPWRGCCAIGGSVLRLRWVCLRVAGTSRYRIASETNQGDVVRRGTLAVQLCEEPDGRV